MHGSNGAGSQLLENGEVWVKTSPCFRTRIGSKTWMATLEAQEPLVEGGHPQIHMAKLCLGLAKTTLMEHEGYISNMEGCNKHSYHHKEGPHIEDWKWWASLDWD